MRRTIPTLRGLAILAVIFNHANWHVLSQFSPGEARGYPFLVLDQIGKFAIPAFMVISGYFTAYATSGGKRNLNWEFIRARLDNLLWPWLIWSVILTVGQSFLGRSISLGELSRNLIIQYYFIPLLILYYLLAPIVVIWARSNARALLAGAALVQSLAVALFYCRVYCPGFPGALKSWVDLGPLQYLRFASYFPFGILCGMLARTVKDRLVQFKSILPWLTLFMLALTVLEAGTAYHLGGDAWPKGGDQTKMSSALFSIAIIFCFAAFDKMSVPFDRAIKKLGTHSYGLYMSHYPVLGILARVFSRIAPWLTSQGWLFLPVLFVLTVALSTLLMDLVSRLPTKRFYRYLFG